MKLWNNQPQHQEQRRNNCDEAHASFGDSVEKTKRGMNIRLEKDGWLQSSKIHLPRETRTRRKDLFFQDFSAKHLLNINVLNQADDHLKYERCETRAREVHDGLRDLHQRRHQVSLRLRDHAARVNHQDPCTRKWRIIQYLENSEFWQTLFVQVQATPEQGWQRQVMPQHCWHCSDHFSSHCYFT